MKKVFFVLMFLMLASGVSAMDDPISVKTQPGDWVKIYAWPATSGPLLTMDDGIADENGTFETTFFSLNVPVKFTIFVIRDKEKIRDVDFLGHNISEPLNIDCTGSGCEIVEKLSEESVEVEIVNESVEVENETLNESVVVDSPELMKNLKEFVFTGKAIFSNGDGSVSWTYSIGGFVILLCFVVFIFGIFRHGKVKSKDALDEDEKELQYMEKKVKETSEKIKEFENKRDRKLRIENAKKKLAEEETRLKQLESEGSEKIEPEVEDQEN